jgi:hypothetical protein
VNASPPAGTHRPRRSPLTLALGAVALAGVLAVPGRANAADEDWGLDVRAGADSVAAGNTVTFSLDVSPTRSADALVDMEIYSARGNKSFQFFWDAQTFTSGRDRTFTTTWQVPGDLPAGRYVVKAGIFRVGWGELFAWNDAATTLQITAPGTSTTTTTMEVPTTTTQATSTTARATTTTQAASTTLAPTTTATATVPPSTEAPSELMFSEDFSTSDGFYARFDHGWSGQDPARWPDSANPRRSWPGDHDASCNGPTTTRQINVADKESVFWWCAPGGDAAKGHVMTGVNTEGYNIAWFSPKQWFDNVTRVCWDQNLTDLGGGKWTQVVLVSEADAARYVGDLGFTGPGFQTDGGPTTGVHPTSGSGGSKTFQGSFEIWRGGTVTGQQDWWTLNGSGFGTSGYADKAARYRHCMVDNEDGSVTISQARPDGRTYTQTVRGDLPDGRVRVVFQDDNYNPDKHDGTSGPNDARYTWHWDNIQIG